MKANGREITGRYVLDLIKMFGKKKRWRRVYT
jgi:hypothetical protein